MSILVAHYYKVLYNTKSCVVSSKKLLGLPRYANKTKQNAALCHQQSRTPNTNAKHETNSINTRLSLHAYAAFLSLLIFLPRLLQLHFFWRASGRLRVSESGRGLPQLTENLESVEMLPVSTRAISVASLCRSSPSASGHASLRSLKSPCVIARKPDVKQPP